MDLNGFSGKAGGQKGAVGPGGVSHSHQTRELLSWSVGLVAGKTAGLSGDVGLTGQ